MTGHTIVFWSPVSGTGTTSNLAATASVMGLECSAHMLLLGHCESHDIALKQCFYQTHASREMDMDVSVNMGVDALLRLLQNRKLQPNMIRDYTLPLLKDRLDLLPGSSKPDDRFIDMATPWMEPLLSMAKRMYDLVFVDGGSGNSSEWTNGLLRLADVLVVCLPQNRLAVHRFFRMDELQAMLATKKHVLVFGKYDRYSSLTHKNLLRPYGRHLRVYLVSYNTRWLDDGQNGQAISYMYRNRQVPREHENYLFMRDVRALALALIEQTGLHNAFFGGKETPI